MSQGKQKKIKQFSFQLITDLENPLIAKIVGIAVSYLADNGDYILFNNNTKLILKELFEDEKIEIIGFDLKFAIKIFLLNNIKMQGKLFDVQIAHYLLHPDKRNSLDIISENYLGFILKEKSTVLGKGRKKVLFSDLESYLITDYACECSVSIFNLSMFFEKEMKEKGVFKLFKEIELPLSKVLAKMELEGISLDINMLKRCVMDF